MSEPIDRRETGRFEYGSLNGSHSISKINLRDERKGLRPLREGPAGMEGQRIQKDTSTIVSLDGGAVQIGSTSSTSTTTHQPADEAAIQVQRDKDRLLALQLLDLEWTSLPPEVQQAIVALLHAVTTGR